MMTSRMMENRKPQKASSIHSSLQSCTDGLHQKAPGSPRGPPRLLTDRHLDILKVILDQMMKMTDAETCFCRREKDTTKKKTHKYLQRCRGYL